jgi:hypothetical protein
MWRHQAGLRNHDGPSEEEARALEARSVEDVESTLR